MGINIGLTNIGDPVDLKWWDSGRCLGDKDFISAEEIEHEYLKDINPYDAEIVWRPKDFKAARKWVLSYDWWQNERFSFPTGNVTRLLELLDKLEANKDLWIDISY